MSTHDEPLSLLTPIAKGSHARGKRQKARGKRQKARGKRQEARGKRQKLIIWFVVVSAVTSVLTFVATAISVDF
jgi:hypothetical protein